MKKAGQSVGIIPIETKLSQPIWIGSSAHYYQMAQRANKDSLEHPEWAEIRISSAHARCHPGVLQTPRASRRPAANLGAQPQREFLLLTKERFDASHPVEILICCRCRYHRRPRHIAERLRRRPTLPGRPRMPWCLWMPRWLRLLRRPRMPWWLRMPWS